MKDRVKPVLVGLSLKATSLNHFILTKNSRKMTAYMLDSLMITMRMNRHKTRQRHRYKPHPGACLAGLLSQHYFTCIPNDHDINCIPMYIDLMVSIE